MMSKIAPELINGGWYQPVAVEKCCKCALSEDCVFAFDHGMAPCMIQNRDDWLDVYYVEVED